MDRVVRKGWVGLALAGVAVVGCGGGGEPVGMPGVEVVAEVVAELPELRVEFAGCEGGEKRANTCLLAGGGVLRFWVAGEVVPEFAIDGIVVVVGDAEAIEKGWRCTISVGAGAHVVSIKRDDALPWSLQVVAAPPTPTLDRIVAGLPDQNDKGRNPRVEAAIVEIEAAVASMGSYERAEALRLATVLTWDLGRDGAVYGRRALAAAIEFGDAGVIMERAKLLNHMLEEGSAEANWVLDVESLYAVNVADAGMLARWRIDVAVQALSIDAMGRGLDHLVAGESLARRIGLHNEEAAAAARRTVILGIYGREAEREGVIERFLALSNAPDGSTVCPDAANLGNVAASFVYAKAGGGGSTDPEPMLRRAIAKFESDPVRCEGGDNADWLSAQALAHANYVFAAVLDARWDLATQRLEWFDAREVPTRLRPLVTVNRAEIALVRGAFSEARRWLAELPSRSDDPLLDWRAAVLRGRFAEARGRRDAALSAYRDAEDIIDRMASSVGVDQGRDGVGVSMYAGAARAIGLLAASNLPSEAAKVARRSRARAFRPVGRGARLAALAPADRRAWATAMAEYERARDRIATELTEAWLLPSDARSAMLGQQETLRSKMRDAHTRAYGILAAAADRSVRDLGDPEPGALWLLYHPAVDGWFGLAITAQGVSVRTIGTLSAGESAETLSRKLLEPFDAEIAEARVIKILAVGRALEVPVHELPWRGRPLIASVPVVWGLDLGASGEEEQRSGALVVADPETRTAGIGRLPHAREEATSVAAALREHGLAVETLVGPAATMAEVLARLPHARWFHYAGHGFGDTANAWDSALPLAGEAQLTVRDVLAMAQVPETVVLSGCETAAGRFGASTGGLSLATAFVLAGSTYVVGSTAEVADEDALDMATTLYRGHVDAADGPAWFRSAVLDGQARGRAWTGPLRVWTR